MKKTISILLSVIIALSVIALSGCGEADVYEKSKNIDNCTVVLKDDNYYKYNNLKFKFNKPREARDISELDNPKGRWVEVVLTMEKCKPTDQELKTLVDDENILLSGAAASKYTYDYKSDKGAVFYFDDDGNPVPEKSYVHIYYDVPTGFMLAKSEVTCFDKVSEYHYI